MNTRYQDRAMSAIVQVVYVTRINTQHQVDPCNMADQWRARATFHDILLRQHICYECFERPSKTYNMLVQQKNAKS